MAAPNAVAWLVDEIREAIRSGGLVPGQRLVEAELSRTHGLSRGPVREALGRLEAEGLVVTEPHRGASVRRMTRRDVGELFVVRGLVEGGAARLAAERVAAGADPAPFAATIAACDAAERDRDGRAYAEANDRFHGAILDLAGNRALSGVAAQLQTHSQRILFLQFMSLDRVEASNQQHRAVAKAVLAGRGEEAEQAMRGHIRATAEVIEALSDQR